MGIDQITNLLYALLQGLSVGVAASITVGPVAVLCIQRTLSRNSHSGYASGFGIACADTLMAILAYFFYSMLQNYIETYNQVLRVAGGIFVIIVGVYVFLQNPVIQIRRNRAGKSSLGQDFASIFGLTLANFIMVVPYILAFFAVFKVPPAETSDLRGMLTGGLTIFGFLTGATLWWSALVLVLSLFRRRFRPRHLLTINHIAGVLIAVLGIYTILSTFLNILPNGVL